MSDFFVTGMDERKQSTFDIKTKIISFPVRLSVSQTFTSEIIHKCVLAGIIKSVDFLEKAIIHHQKYLSGVHFYKHVCTVSRRKC